MTDHEADDDALPPTPTEVSAARLGSMEGATNLEIVSHARLGARAAVEAERDANEAAARMKRRQALTVLVEALHGALVRRLDTVLLDPLTSSLWRHWVHSAHAAAQEKGKAPLCVRALAEYLGEGGRHPSLSALGEALSTPGLLGPAELEVELRAALAVPDPLVQWLWRAGAARNVVAHVLEYRADRLQRSLAATLQQTGGLVTRVAAGDSWDIDVPDHALRRLEWLARCTLKKELLPEP